jgi:phosphoheptose isomerase
MPLVVCDVVIRFVALQTWQHPTTPKTSLVRAVSLVYATWPIYLVAWIMAVLRLPLSFRSTPKGVGRLNPAWLLPQEATLLLLILGMIYTVVIGGHSPSILLVFAILQGFLQLIILSQWLYSEIKMPEGVPKYLQTAKNLFPSVRITRREVNGKIRTYITNLPLTIDPLPLESIEKAITMINSKRKQGRQIFVMGDDISSTMANLFARELGKDTLQGEIRICLVRNSRTFTEATPRVRNWNNFKEISTLELPHLIQQSDVLVGIAVDDKLPTIIAGVNLARKAKAKIILITGMIQERTIQADVKVYIPGDSQEQVEEALLILLHIVSKALHEMIENDERAEYKQRSPSMPLVLDADPVNPCFTNMINRDFPFVTTSDRAKLLMKNLRELNEPNFGDYLTEYHLRKLLEVSLEIFGATSGSLIILNERGDVNLAAIAYERKVNLYPADHLLDTIQQGLAGWVLAECQPALIEDTKDDPRWLRRSWDESPSSRSAMSTPILEGDRSIGVLTIVHKNPRYFRSADLDLLVAIAAINTEKFTPISRSAVSPSMVV